MHNAILWFVLHFAYWLSDDLDLYLPFVCAMQWYIYIYMCVCVYTYMCIHIKLILRIQHHVEAPVAPEGIII